MKIFNLILLLLLFVACKQNPTQNVNSKKLSVEMADAAISRFDSLINYNNPKKIKWQYDIAFLGTSIDRLGDKDPRYSKYLSDFIDYFIEEDGSVKHYKQQDYNLDHINAAKALFTLYKRTGEEKYKTAIFNFIEQLINQPRTASGGFWHKKKYPNQMWLDGLYMSSPFMAQFAREFNQPAWYDSAFKQISLIYSKTLDTSTGLLYHAVDESKTEQWCNPETGKSPHFWSRAMGWYSMAIVDVLDYLPEDYPQRDSLIVILNNVCEALIKVRNPENKLWYQVLDMADSVGNYPEASGTLMFVYVFAKGAKNKYLPSEYYSIAEESFEASVQQFIKYDKDGLPILTNVCGGCGLGGKPYRDGSYNYYITEKRVDNDPKGVAPFILAAIELGN